MRIAVTGSAGRLGQTAVRLLREAGHAVLPIDRLPDETEPATRETDLANYDGLPALFEGCDVIVHLGNLPGFSGQRRPGGFANNTAANFNVFFAADELGIRRVIYASSIQAYGCFGSTVDRGASYTPPLYLPIDEDHPRQPADAYALSKASGEWIAESFVRRRPDLTVWSLRFTGIRLDPPRRPPGPRDWPEEARFRGAMFTGVHVEDAARAILLCCQAERPGHTPLNIVSPVSARPWSEALIRSAYGVAVPFRRPLAPTDALVSGQRAEELLGFRATRPINLWTM